MTKSDEHFGNPIEIAFEMLQNGEQKEIALFLIDDASGIIDDPNIEFESKKAISHIFASVYAWNNDYLKARQYHFNFLNDDEFCKNYKETVESYLALVFAKNNVNFIEQLLQDFPIIKTGFQDIYKAYLGAVVNPNSEEYFDANLVKEYNLLLRAKKLYSE